MRGETLTPAAKSTLVHELTRALQDQHFDLAGQYDGSRMTPALAQEAAFQAEVRRVAQGCA